MRDPARIPQILKAIDIYWTMNSDLRLGQLLSNLIREIEFKEEEDHDIRLIEDDKIFKHLFEKISKMNLQEVYEKDLYKPQ